MTRSGRAVALLCLTIVLGSCGHRIADSSPVDTSSLDTSLVDSSSVDTSSLDASLAVPPALTSPTTTPSVSRSSDSAKPSSDGDGAQVSHDTALPAVLDTISLAATATTAAGRAAGSACVGRPAAAAGDEQISLTSAGRQRTAIVHVPPGYSADRPVAVIFDFHGHGGNARAAQRRHQLDPLADRDGVVMVYPQGLEQLDGSNGWATGAPQRDGGDVDDVVFIDDLVARIDADYCIDATRLFATGHSNGGGMTALLACRRPTTFAAVAPVSGAFYGACRPDRPVPLLEIHGTADRVVPYDGNDLLPPIRSWIDAWATGNNCAASSTAGELTTWQGCAAPVVHLAISGAGHDYPASVAPSLIWEFFTGLGL